MPWGPVPEDAFGVESCVVVAPGAGVEFCAASAALFFLASAASMARITLLLTPAWFSDCKPVEERSNWLSLAAMAAVIVLSAVPALTIFMTSALVRGDCC